MAGKKKEAREGKQALFGVVRIRGPVDVKTKIEDTMVMLRLNRVNHCVLVPNDPSHLGMLRKSKECITWGEISPEMLEKLLLKRGKISGKPLQKKDAAELAKKMVESGRPDEAARQVFRLNPPSRGHKSIRRFYPKGSLGYRGEKINDLLNKMV